MENLDTTDESLVASVLSGEENAYKTLHERYQAKLLRYANYLLGDPDLASDVVQDSFIKAYSNLSSFDQTRKFSSWIYRIVHNESVNAGKKHSREVILTEEIENQVDLVEEVSRQEVIQNLRDSVEKLPLGYKEPIVLHFFDDKSYEEISEILKLPEGTVATRINRGKKLLKLLQSGV